MDANDELFRGNNYQKPNLVAVHVHQTAYKPPQHSTQYVNQPPQNAYYTPQPSTQYIYVPQPQNNNRRV